MIYSSGYSYPIPIQWTHFADELALKSKAITRQPTRAYLPEHCISHDTDPDSFVFRSRPQNTATSAHQFGPASAEFRSMRVR